MPLSSRSPSPPSSPSAEGLDSLTQPTATKVTNRQYPRSFTLPSPVESLYRVPGPNSPASSDSDDEQEPPDLVVQADPKENTQSDDDDDKEDEFHAYFMRSQEHRQKIFLQDESERNHQFHESEVARGKEWKRTYIFDEKMKQWSTKSQIEQIRGREEERAKRESQRVVAFRKAELQRWIAFEESMAKIMEQAYHEEYLEEIHYKGQEEMLLALYEHQAIELNQRTEDQIVWFKFMRGRYPPPDWRFEPLYVLQEASPITEIPDSVEHNMNKQQGRFAISKRMQEIFDRSQERRAEAFRNGAKGRNYTFTIKEAKREAKFEKAQQKRKETFDEAELLRESRFEEAQQQRESEFEANERKREDDFNKNEVERNDQARKARESRAQQFQPIMLKLQQQCMDDEKDRMKDLELLGEELITSRERGLPLSHDKFPRRHLHRWLWPPVKRDFSI
ncbi:hypothetical protein C0993_010343 [Termitomyces sp. T159_Od127]|nr:hypothetical protein C0993_010343 [Termitomyces sp. T159_Od127]